MIIITLCSVHGNATTCQIELAELREIDLAISITFGNHVATVRAVLSSLHSKNKMVHRRTSLKEAAAMVNQKPDFPSFRVRTTFREPALHVIMPDA